MSQKVYETTILLHAGQARADYDGTVAKLRAHYETEGAEWIELEKWDERKLAYPIKGETSAMYLIGYFKADADAVERIERRCQLSGEVLRQLILLRDGPDYDRIRDQRAKAAERAARHSEEAALAAAEGE